MKPAPEPANRRWLGVAFAVASLALVFGVFGAALAIRRAALVSEEVNAAFVVLARIDSVQTRLAEIAASQRAYLITRDPLYLSRYRRNDADIREAVRDFRRTARTPAQAARAAAVEQAVFRRIELADRALAAAPNVSPDSSVMELVRRGTDAADIVRAMLSEARGEQEDQVRLHTGTHKRTSTASVGAVAVTAVGALAALAVALATIRRDLARRLQAERGQHAADARATAAERQVVSIVDNLSIGFLVVDPQSRISISNPAAAVLLGHSGGHLHGSSLAEACPEAIRASLDPPPAGAPHVSEHPIAGRWIRVAVYPAGDDGSLAIFLEDVHELRSAHDRSLELLDRLAQTNDLLNAIFEGSRDLIAAADAEFRLTACNTAYIAEFRRLFGREIAIGDNIAGVLAPLPEEQEKARAIWRRAMTGEGFTVVQQFGSSSRDPRWYEIRYNPIRNSRGEIAGASHIIRDITERIAEEARLVASKEILERLVGDRTRDLQHALDHLQLSERRWSTLVEAAPLIVWNTDPAGLIKYCNSRWYEYTGAPAGASVDSATEYIHPDDRDRRAQAWTRALAEDQPYEAEYRLRRADGLYRWHLARGVALRGPDATIIGWFGVSIDIEDQKRAAELLLDSHARLEVLVAGRTTELRAEIARRERVEEDLRVSLREKEVLLQEVHHRVKNNLQVVSSILSLQSDQAPNAASREMLNESCQRVLSMALIHENLYRSGDLSRVHLNRYIDQVAQNLLSSSETRNGARISYVLEESSPILLAIDRAIPCGLILNELLSNSLKHAFPGRGGAIRVRLDSQAGTLRLTVADDGIGLPSGFDLSAPRSLGLQIVGTLVRQLRGRLTFRTSGGAEFTVEFPESLPMTSTPPTAPASH